MEKNELQKAWKEAYSNENREAHEAAGRDVDYLGSIARGQRIYDMYRDEAGGYWYRVRIHLDSGEIVSEQEAIFGQKKKRSGKRF